MTTKTKKNIDELERLVDVEKFLNQNNIEYFNTNKHYRFSCPLHYQSDNITSAIIYHNTHFFRCFADKNCSNGTSIPFIQFIIKFFKYKSFHQGRKWLENFTGVKAKTDYIKKENKDEFNIQLFVPKEPIKNIKIDKKYSLFFNKAITSDIDYYYQRRIDINIRRFFNIRYRKDYWMKNRIVFPIADEYGKTVAYSGRYIYDEDIGNIDEELTKLLGHTIVIGKYKNSPEDILKTNLLYNLHNVKNKNICIVVEGFFDVWRLYSYGFPSVGIMGSSLSEIQAYLLIKYFKNKVVFLYFDGDESGRKCAKQAYDVLKPYINKLYIVYTTPYKDPDSISKLKTLTLIKEALK